MVFVPPPPPPVATHGPTDNPGKLPTLKQDLGIALGLLVAVVLAFNLGSVPVRLIFVTVQVPLALAMLVVFLLGAASGLLLRRRRRVRSGARRG